MHLAEHTAGPVLGADQNFYISHSSPFLAPQTHGFLFKDLHAVQNVRPALGGQPRGLQPELKALVIETNDAAVANHPLALKIAKRAKGIMVFWPDFKLLWFGLVLFEAKGCQ